ncbi:hypothetical protein E2556_00405 [Staphylococcus croceilyticus]|uniref:VraH family protein n=1 Tax=Staphylococcus croceilyticus TaxID=319942 RepID=A0ABY2KFM9_9STAP|nr:hypothetical protein [Staphylococcus croceilyticus]PNZ67900.1 hypothetical protein CD128_07265 [Staphylococcus croceilyticus]TGA80831.1 hypothetical protein E2556_00405 [Staphylococcus croceilyticus]
MNIKESIRKSYEDLLSLKVNWFNGLILVLIVFVLSSIATPIVGVPVGLLGGGYFLKRYEEKNN